MATRKAEEDVLARTEAERKIGEELQSLGLIDDTTNETAGLARELLNVLAKAVQFETGTSKDPDRNEVPMRRLVLTFNWEVDPSRVGK
jgi:hypothetical protein